MDITNGWVTKIPVTLLAEALPVSDSDCPLNQFGRRLLAPFT